MSDDPHVRHVMLACIDAILSNSPTVTLSTTSKKWPAGFPRGELLSVGTNGSRNYAIDPVKVLGWMRKQAGITKAAAR